MKQNYTKHRHEKKFKYKILTRANNKTKSKKNKK